MRFNLNDGSQEKGVVLVTALFYLLIITFLVISSFSTGLLQTKIGEHLHQEIQAFENAESALWMGEQAILIDQEQGKGEFGTSIRYQFQRRSRSACGLFYEIDAIATVAVATVHLQSVFVFPKEGTNPCGDDLTIPHRVAWRQVKT